MSKLNDTVSLARLQEVLHYDPETGIFRWKVALNRLNSRIKAGDVAGSNREGYRQISIDCKDYQAHRLAWLYMTGALPTKFIDHINGVRADNRFGNLREATKTQNAQNSRFSRGKSTWRGVSWSKQRKKWQARIKVNGKFRHLGFFKDEEKAAEAYQSAQRLFHPYAPVNQTDFDTNSGNCKCEPELSPGLT